MLKPGSSLSPVLLMVFLIGAIAPMVAAISEVGASSAFHFSSGSPDGRVAVASRPSSAGKIEIEAGDDFVLNHTTTIKNVTFTGLIPSTGPTVGEVAVEIFMVFPINSTYPPSTNVPTRTNSPSDFSFKERVRNSTSAGLSYTMSVLSNTFSASNSVVNGINKSPNQHTGGEGAVTGQEVLFNLTLTPPLTLPYGHYFFVPQVMLSSGDFLWLSAPLPVMSGTPFTPDLQTWIRNSNLDPDWLRVGTDIIGSITLNAAFTLDGTFSVTSAPVFPLPAMIVVVLTFTVALVCKRMRVIAHP